MGLAFKKPEVALDRYPYDWRMKRFMPYNPNLFFIMGQKLKQPDAKGRTWWDKPYHISEYETVFDMTQDIEDSYISMNWFYKCSRRGEFVAVFDHICIDLDCYKADKLAELGRDILWMFPEFIEVPDTVKDTTAYRRTVLEQLVEPYLQPFITKKSIDFSYDRMLMPALGHFSKSFSQAQKATLRAIWEGLKPTEISMLWWNNDFSRLMTCLDTDKAMKALLRQIEKPGKLAQCPITEKKKIPAKAYLVLNVETTGREDHDQVLQITITNHKGNLLYNRFCQPSVSIQKEATDYHHMTNDILTRANIMGNQGVTTWQEIYPEVVKHLSSRTVYAFNVTFDAQMVLNTCKAFNLDTGWMKTCHWVDMKLFMNSATRIGRLLSSELVGKFGKTMDGPVQIIPFPSHRWQQFARVENLQI